MNPRVQISGLQYPLILYLPFPPPCPCIFFFAKIGGKKRKKAVAATISAAWVPKGWGLSSGSPPRISLGGNTEESKPGQFLLQGNDRHPHTPPLLSAVEPDALWRRAAATVNSGPLFLSGWLRGSFYSLESGEPGGGASSPQPSLHLPPFPGSRPALVRGFNILNTVFCPTVAGDV